MLLPWKPAAGEAIITLEIKVTRSNNLIILFALTFDLLVRSDL